MTDYEVLSLSCEFAESTQETFMSCVGVRMAVILAACLVADRLTTKMTVVTVALSTAVTLQQGTGT